MQGLHGDPNRLHPRADKVRLVALLEFPLPQRLVKLQCEDGPPQEGDLDPDGVVVPAGRAPLHQDGLQARGCNRVSGDWICGRLSGR